MRRRRLYAADEVRAVQGPDAVVWSGRYQLVQVDLAEPPVDDFRWQWAQDRDGAADVDDLVAHLRSGGALLPLVSDDPTAGFSDGNHRWVALWLAGARSHPAFVRVT